MEIPQLPLVPRWINRAGAALDRVGLSAAALGTEALIAGARKATGLPDADLGDAREGLDRLVESIREEAALTWIGRLIARADLGRIVAQRMQLEDWHARHPEIGEQPIRRPIVIVGQGRTGTTILHELLMLDPANRVPLSWEVDAPFPPPERATYASDPRIEACQRQLDRSESLIPEFKRIHRMGARLPQECVRIMACDFRSLIYPSQFRVPGYAEWLVDTTSMQSAYRVHRRFLQVLQWHCPAERWVLKSPGHLWCLDALLDVYPDACLVQTHRDPLAIISSLTSLECVLRKMCTDDVRPFEIAREWTGWLQRAYDRSVDFRQSGRIPDSRIVDLHFGRFMRDPIANVRTLYDRFDLELRPEVEQTMRDYLAHNPSDRDGRHRHAFADTGLDLEEERARVKRYVDYFQVPEEGEGGRDRR